VNLPGSVVDIFWLKQNLSSPHLRVLDASWCLPNSSRDTEIEFISSHIPGSVYFDIDLISDSNSNLPHMLPTPNKFSECVGSLGISNKDTIVVYDSHGIFSSPRVWWMFRVFGHNKIAVLQGGLPAWQKNNGKLEKGNPNIKPTKFNTNFSPKLLRNADEIKSNIKGGLEQIVDARSNGRFLGEEPEPREGLRSGHIPESINLPYTSLIDSSTGFLLSPSKIFIIAKEIGLDLNRPITTTCGSGISAALLALAFHTVGHKSTAVYDGSWTEWGGSNNKPIISSKTDKSNA